MSTLSTADIVTFVRARHAQAPIIEDPYAQRTQAPIIQDPHSRADTQVLCGPLLGLDP